MFSFKKVSFGNGGLNGLVNKDKQNIKIGVCNPSAWDKIVSNIINQLAKAAVDQSKNV